MLVVSEGVVSHSYGPTNKIVTFESPFSNSQVMKRIQRKSCAGMFCECVCAYNNIVCSLLTIISNEYTNFVLHLARHLETSLLDIYVHSYMCISAPLLYNLIW